MTEREGPGLESLLHRLAETPTEFLATPSVGNVGAVHVAAVVGDLCRALGEPVSDEALSRFVGQSPADASRLSVALVLAWLLADEGLRAATPGQGLAVPLLDEGAAELALQTPARKFIEDPDRREEIARFALARLGLRPRGETRAQADDRLTSLSATERARVMKAARAAEERARAIREALAKKAAEEAADKWSRE